MVCSLSLYIQFHKQKLRHSFRIFCPSAVPFFLVVYYLLIHNFSYSIADMIHLVHINGMYPAFSNQLHNRFDVFRMREKIHRQAAAGAVAVAPEQHNVAGEGFGVAADVDDAAGVHFCHGGDAFRRAACARRVQENHVRA